MTQEGRAGLDRLRPVCFRIKWALEDGGMESVVGRIHELCGRNAAFLSPTLPYLVSDPGADRSLHTYMSLLAGVSGETWRLVWSPEEICLLPSCAVWLVVVLQAFL